VRQAGQQRKGDGCVRKGLTVLTRLGLVAGVTTVIGTASIIGAPAAFASSPTNSSLAINPTTTGSTATATVGFTTSSATNANGASPNSISISTYDTSGSTPSQTTAEGLPESAADYTVSFTPPGGSPSTDTVTSVSPASTSGAYSYTAEVINLGAPIPGGAAVTVTITNVLNPSNPSTVYFSDATSGDTTAQDTNPVSIGNPSVVTPTVTDVNPQALPSNSPGTPFTITGTGFAQTGTYSPPNNIGPNGFPNAPAVCLVPAGTTPPSASGVGAGGSCPTGTYTSFVYFASSTEIKAQTPELPNTSNATYDVVVYNYDPSTNAYIGPSATSAADQVAAIPNLNFIPESGVRVVDSRTGMNMPRGPIPSGSVIAIPLSSFADSPTQPDNLPGNLNAVPSVTSLAMNVTAVAPSSPGNLQLIAANGSCPAAPTGATTPAQTHPATVNFQPPQDTSNYSIIPITSNDTVLCVYDSGAPVNVVMDLTGYTVPLTNGSGVVTNDGFGGNQQRLLDTRYGYSAVPGAGLLGPLPGGTVYSVQLPSGLDNKTVAFNVAAVGPSAVGNLRLFPEPAGGPPAPDAVPNTAVVNYIPGTDASSFYIVAVPPSGKVDLYSDSAGTVNVVLDEYGTVDSANVHSLAEPFRVFDSRPGGIASGSSAMVNASPSGSGSDFIPAGAVAAIGSLSDIDPTAVGNVRTYPYGTPVPNAASMPNYPGQVRENLIVSALNLTSGAFGIYSDGATINSTFDATAYIM
jgi:hypothetical protein